MLPSHQSPELAAAIIGMIANGNLKINRDSITGNISQIVLTEDAALKLQCYSVHCAYSTEAAKRPELAGYTYVTTPGAIVAIAPDVAGNLDAAQEIRLKPYRPDIPLG